MPELKLIIQKIGQKKTFQTQKPTTKNAYRVNKMKGKKWTVLMKE